LEDWKNYKVKRLEGFKVARLGEGFENWKIERLEN
jgi:hypothetical protein